MAKRHHNALAIQQGACNPSGILHSMLEACQEIRAEPNQGTISLTTDLALRLMLHQLAYIMAANDVCFAVSADNSDWYNSYIAECHKHVEADLVKTSPLTGERVFPERAPFFEGNKPTL